MFKDMREFGENRTNFAFDMLNEFHFHHFEDGKRRFFKDHLEFEKFELFKFNLLETANVYSTSLNG